MGSLGTFEILIIFGAVAVIIVIVIGFVVGRKRSERALEQQSVQRNQQQALEAEYDSDTDVLLLRIWLQQGQVLKEQREQTRRLGTISTAAGVILILIILSAIAGCLSMLLGGSLLGSFL